MQDDPGSQMPARPPREEPPSGAKVTLVLVGILAAICITCVLFTGAYGYFVEVKSLR